MSASVEFLEPVSGLPWTVIRGAREPVFRALGELHAEQIAGIRARAGQQWSELMTRVQHPLWADRLSRVIERTTHQLPIEAQELSWMAVGAGLPELDLWVYNLRGDLGRDGIGCSDVCLATPHRLLMGHNEDGDAALAGDIRLITLDIDGDPSCTVIWYPGMLPANSFVATSAGLAFGLDHVPVVTPDLDGCGRHFVARHAQRQPDGEAARAAVAGFSCAGGFSFDIADGPGRRADIVENAAGRVRGVCAPPDEVLCHTNHLRLVDGTEPGLRVADDDEWMLESRARRLALTAAVGEVGADDAASVRAALRAPGVLNRREDLWTLATAVVDLLADTITVQARGDAWTGSFAAFARGERAQTE
ncbi:C45 family autoproteolytic acyltransferase/hydolase [Pseudoclavibacter soli]|uniref:C45 family autoproteolytic acyltransferase/hydolase n=1 Tax=Pseudoclavibacter soli TaxID=452623 RepID=UPI0004185040|nr:C45 family peptidase [Pseudoclavibacter soli]